MGLRLRQMALSIVAKVEEPEAGIADVIPVYRIPINLA